jgi:hypothetical protein
MPRLPENKRWTDDLEKLQTIAQVVVIGEETLTILPKMDR